MPIDLEALLQPISAEQPSGADLRYQPVTDQIKEARREEDDLAQGVWKRDVKTADYALVIKLAKEALTKRSKDLQIAAWLTEALLNTERYAGFRQGLELLRRLLEEFWETVYPQMDEDGDLEYRATPLRWVGSQLDRAIRSVPLTQGGHNWYQYRESKAIPSEEEARMDQAKLQKRTEALNEGSVSPEEFEKGFETTSQAFSQKVFEELTGLVEFVQELSTFCDEKFGDAAPDYSPLRTTLEDVGTTARMLLMKKGGPMHAEAPAEPLVEEPGFVEPEAAPVSYQNAPPPQPAVRRATGGGMEPSSADDAGERLLAAARYLRREFPFTPMPYMIPRALRWGELRGAGAYPNAMFLSPPPSEVRMELKRLANESNWDELRQKAEEAAGMSCGRAWLDVQRYAVTACRMCGAEMPAQAILSGLRSLLADFPQMPQWVMADDTPVANAETMQWLMENALLPIQAPVAVPEPPPPPQPQWAPPPMAQPTMNGDGEPAPPDAYDLAMQAAQTGNTAEALGILSREIAQERCGRGRFLRRVQLAQVCLATGNEEVARPILQELAEEIERLGLEAWEGAEVVAPPLSLLYRTLGHASDFEEERHKLYARICRLDPAGALSLQR